MIWLGFLTVIILMIWLWSALLDAIRENTEEIRNLVSHQERLAGKIIDINNKIDEARWRARNSD